MRRSRKKSVNQWEKKLELKIELIQNLRNNKPKIIRNMRPRLIPNAVNHRNYKRSSSREKKINEYITLKMENGRTHIYVNGRRFIQCIRLILNIQKIDVDLYEEVDSIDEAAKLYEKHVFQNRIVRGPMAAHMPNQVCDITPEQEFWGHCSNIQTWVEHDYDTRILMSNISFPLLRVLSEAGDPLAKKVFKEEIALRLESGYPSVVQYLINQGYIKQFTPSEFKTILESTNLIKNLSSESGMLRRFLLSCISAFPKSIGDILLELLKLPEGKTNLISSLSLKPGISRTRFYFGFNPRFLSIIKKAFEDLLLQVDENMHDDIIDCMKAIENNIGSMDRNFPNISGRSRLDFIRRRILLENPNGADLDEKLQLMEKFFGQNQRLQSKCRYCGKMIQKGQDTCDWCGHKKDDDEGGFFPYPFIFKPPGGGGGLNRNLIAIPIKVKLQN